MTATTPTKPASEQGAVSGWKLVPVEPLPEMLGAFWRVKNGHHFAGEPAPTDRSDYAAYRAMLAAAPAPAASPPSMVRIKSALDHLWSEALRRQKEGGMIDPCWLETVIQPARASLASDATANSQKPYAYAWRYAGEVAWHLSFDKPRARYHDDIEYHELFLSSPPSGPLIPPRATGAATRKDAGRGGGKATPSPAVEDVRGSLAKAAADEREAAAAIQWLREQPGCSYVATLRDVDEALRFIRARTLATPETEPSHDG